MRISRKYKVYKHTFPDGKVYIGITGMKLAERWANGFGYKTQKNMFRAIVEFGWDNIKHELLYDNLTEREALYIENKLIGKYKSNNLRYGYNTVKINIDKPNTFKRKVLKNGNMTYREKIIEINLEDLYI